MLQRTAVLASLYFGAVSPVWAQQRPVIVPPSKTVTAGSALYYEGELLLRRGRKFERAAGLFGQAAEKEAKNPAYPLAVGCAYTNRVASLAHAAAFTKMHADVLRDYSRQLAQWEEEQKEPGSYLYGTEKPKPFSARIYRIKDDGVPYRLTPEQLTARLSELCGKAQAAFDKGVGLAQSPEEQAEAEYVRGWGRYLLRTYVASAGGNVDKDLPAEPEETDPLDEELPLPVSEEPEEIPLAVKNVPTRKEINTAFARATKLSPQNSIYWESQSAAIDNKERAKEWMREALKLAPKNAPLWYKLFDLQMGSENGNAAAPESREAARECLIHAAKYDSANAYPLYMQAYLLYADAGIHGGMTGQNGLNLMGEDVLTVPALFRDARTRGLFQNALQLAEVGNALPRFETPYYRPPLPRLLLPGWQYQSILLEKTYSWMAKSRELSRRLSVHAYLASQEKPSAEEGLRAARAIGGIGAKMIGDWPIQSRKTGDDTFIMVFTGKAIVTMGYSLRINLHRMAGDKEAVKAVQAEFAAFQKKNAQHSAIWTKYIEDEDIY